MKKTSKNTMVTGVAWMTAANISSKILAAAYIIPWYSWFGDNKLQANALYTKGFTVYSLFLMLSTAGLPAAISKQISHYNSLGEYNSSFRLFKGSIVLAAVLGIIIGGLMWSLSPILAAGDYRMVSIFRSLASAVMIIPIMSVGRGFFQGFKDMKPSAISQFAEQLFRIIYMLIATYIIMKIVKGSYVSGIIQSTFAAFIGAVAGTGVLIFFFMKKIKQYRSLREESIDGLTTSTVNLVVEVIKQAIPFIFVGVATSLYGLIDQYTFIPILEKYTNYTMYKINDIYTLFAGNANKLIMIIISLATAMAMTAIPILTESITKNDKNNARNQIVNSIELLLSIMLPSAFGMAAVAKPLYIVFYGYGKFNNYGISVLKVACYMAIFQGVFLLLADILQGIYENKYAVLFTFYGIIIKLLVQLPLIIYFEAYGPLIATAIGMTFSSLLMVFHLRKNFFFESKKLIKTITQLLLGSIIMFILVLIIEKIFDLITLNRILCFFELLVLIIIGSLVYGYYLLKTNLAYQLLGERSLSIKRRFHIK